MQCMLSRSTLGMSVAVRYPDYLGVGTGAVKCLAGGQGTCRAYAHVVAGNSSRARARARIEAICAESLDDRSLRLRVLAVLREVIDFDAYVWLLTDPVTAVGVAPLAEVPCLPELPALIRAKYATPANRWTVLRLQSSPAGTLSDAVAGDLSRSLMWRAVLSRYGIGDVASAVFADHFGCWGFLDLWRNNTSVPFSGADATFIAAVAAPLATGLRHCQARTFIDPATSHRPELGPVVLTLDDHLRIASRTAASRAWLDALLPPEPDQKAIPASVYNVAAQLLAVENGVDSHPAFARTHLADGFWLALRAARLSPDQPPAERAASIVVTIEEASASERLELFGRAFGLSAREYELFGLLATGSDTRTMARQMSLSEHTIQDHLKSIFAKTDAHDRVTVLSRAFGTRR
jgi:DNA-binding CsgD family transcriptional regulator